MFKLGIERLSEYQSLFKEKRVGLITNPTGVDQALKSTITWLNETTNLKALYAPEHGVRGDLQAGARLDGYHDPETDVPVYSLYGATKKPTAEMLQAIDVLCFDIQDVGARFYTYIYTMAYSMMAAKEQGKQFVVFDRPNPLGDQVEGNLLDLDYRSFVGYYPMPQRHGLTVGELAKLFNTVYGIECDLTVIPMEGYKRNQTIFDFDYPFILPSPNLPTKESLFYYMMTTPFEGTNISEGRGTTKPFQFIGAPFLDAEKIIKRYKAISDSTLTLRKVYFTPTFSKHANELCEGLELYINDLNQNHLVYEGLKLLMIIKETHEAFEYNKPYKEGLHPMIDLLTGTNQIRNGTLTVETLKSFLMNHQSFIKQKASVKIYD